MFFFFFFFFLGGGAVPLPIFDLKLPSSRLKTTYLTNCSKSQIFQRKAGVQGAAAPWHQNDCIHNLSRIFFFFFFFKGGGPRGRHPPAIKNFDLKAKVSNLKKKKKEGAQGAAPPGH